MILNQDFKEFIELLNANDVRYLVVGGYAVAIHGHPRYTKDLDIWIEAEASNAARVVTALKQFGFDALGLIAEDFLQPQQVVQLGYPPHRIDLLTSVAGTEFPECYENRSSVEIGGVTIAFIGLSDLKRNKAASGRPQDLADLGKLR